MFNLTSFYNNSFFSKSIKIKLNQNPMKPTLQIVQNYNQDCTNQPTNQLKFKLTAIVMLLAIFFAPKLSFADGETCSTPYTVTPNENYDTHDFLINNSDGSVWFSFVANTVAIEVHSYDNPTEPGTVANEFYHYSGTCGYLVLDNSLVADLTNYGDRKFLIENLIIGETYFLKVIGEKANNNLKVSFTEIVTAPFIAPCTISNPDFVFSGLASYDLPTIPDNSSIEVGAGVTINVVEARILKNCKVVMGIGSRIVLKSGVLEIKGGTRIFSCSKMWNGIEVVGGEFMLYENSMISDANTAVSVIGGYVWIYDAIFNRNVRGVVFRNTILSTCLQAPISNTIFTSRDFYLSFTSPNPLIATLKSINGGTGIPYLEDYPIVSLLNPNITRPYSSIIDLHIYSTPLTIGKLPASLTYSNILEDHDYGIISYQTKTACYNNTFQYMPKTISANTSPYFKYGGIGILAIGGTANASNNYGLYVGTSIVTNPGTNTFFNCFKGVNSYFYSNNYVRFNNFSSDDINNSFYSLAIHLLPSTNGNTFVFQNNISDLLEGTSCYIADPNFSFNLFNFTGNTINVGPPVNSNLVSKAMTFDGVGDLNSHQPEPKINANVITGAKMGINLNLFLRNTIIENNTITLVGSPTSIGSINSGILLNNSNQCKIYTNTIDGDYYKLASDKFGTGIRLNHSNDCEVACNNVSKVRQCFVFEGDCDATFSNYIFHHNTMSNCRDGLVMLNNGKIGPNGSSSFPADNVWVTDFDNSETLADNTDWSNQGAGSFFYCRLGATYTPSLNKFINGFPNYVLVPMFASGLHSQCVSTPPAPIVQNDPEDRVEDLTAEESEYIVLGDESEWQNKQTAFKELSFNPAFTNIIEPALNSFVSSTQNENIAKVVWTDEMIKQFDLFAAKNLVNVLTPENLMEQNYQSFTKNYIAWYENANYKYTAAELNEINTVANQCANTGGTTVLKAQLFAKHILNSSTVWNTNCPIPASAQRKTKDITKENTLEMPVDFYFSLACNPCEGAINYKIANRQFVASLLLTDILGNNIRELNTLEGLNNLLIEEFKSGVYFLNLKLISGKLITKKLVIAN